MFIHHNEYGQQGIKYIEIFTNMISYGRMSKLTYCTSTASISGIGIPGMTSAIIADRS